MKEASELKKVIEFYDSKNYKKGLKKLEKLIEEGAAPAEYHSMKALFHYFIPELSAGALALAKTALTKKLNSPFAWQVCGIIQRNSRNYKEAAKCFENALKFNSKSLNLLRETANLALHSRDLIRNRDLRKKQLLLKPGIL